MTFTLAALFLFGLFLAIDGKPTVDLCKDTLDKNGLDSSRFGNAVAHGLHALTLEDLRYFFEPNAGEDNQIPKVNFNLAADKMILDNTPLAGYDKSLSSPAFQAMDFVFRNDGPNFLQLRGTTMEKLGHFFHMQEFWTRAQPFYRALKAKEPENVQDLCRCANMEEENGIRKELEIVVQAVQHFGDGTSKIDNSNRYCIRYKVNGYFSNSYSNCESPTAENPNGESWQPETVTGEHSFRAADAKNYDLFRKMLDFSMLPDNEIRMFATFLFCRLNHFDKSK